MKPKPGAINSPGLIIFLAAVLSYCCPVPGSLHAGQDPFEVLPWEVGQYAEYQIVSMEGEDRANRYRIALTGKEELEGKIYFWVRLDIYGQRVSYGYNRIENSLEHSASFKALVPVKDSDIFRQDPASFIAGGLFLKEAVKLEFQGESGRWAPLDPASLFAGAGVLEDTPYMLSPHARGAVDFRRLRAGSLPEEIRVPAGSIPSFHFSVKTPPSGEYWDEGIDLWRSGSVPILGLVRMEFSKTGFWKKRQYRVSRIQGLFQRLSAQRAAGRMRPDSATIILLDYGPR